MTREQKVEKLEAFCEKRKQCRGCKLEESRDDEYDGLCDFSCVTNIGLDALMYRAFGTPVTDDLTGAVKEKPKTVVELLNEVSSEICDNYCKYPNEMTDSDEMIKTVCSKCPLQKLN